MNSRGNNNKNKASQNNQSFDPGLELKKGLYYHQTGNLSEAEITYKKVLEVNPSNSDASHLLGYISYQKGNHLTALDLILKAIKISPDNPIFHNNLGLVFKELGRSEEAVFAYKKALLLKPDMAEASYNAGVVFHDEGKLDKAVCYYIKAIEIKSDIAEIHFRLGKAFQAQQKLDDAIKCYQKTIEIAPDYAEPYISIGNSFQDKKNPIKAIPYYEKALKIKPDHIEAFNNMGNAFNSLEKQDEAIWCYKKALEFKPDYVELIYNMGVSLMNKGMLSNAESSFKQVLELQPGSAETNYNLGNICKDMLRFNEAVPYYRKAIQIKSDYAEAYNNIGIILNKQGLSTTALESYKEAVSINPEYGSAYENIGLFYSERGDLDSTIDYFQKALHVSHDNIRILSYLVFKMQQSCRWQGLDELKKKLEDLSFKAQQKNMLHPPPPFISIAIIDNPESNFFHAKARSDEAKRIASNSSPSFTFEKRKISNGKITVGYMSNDYRNHPVAHLILGLFALHDRKRFNIFCYSLGKDDESSYRTLIKKNCDKFIDLSTINDKDAANRIFDDKVDILIDLTGHTKGDRLGITALRPSPIQVNYLGFPGTTGADFFDYIITDQTVSPPEHKPYFSENFVYMPYCYQITDDKQKISSTGRDKVFFGLPKNSFVFCSFNQLYKIEPVIFSLWMNILRQVKSSILWLMPAGQKIKDLLQNEAQSRGIDRSRIFFADKLPDKSDHLERLSLVDLALDTKTYNGQTTTIDALWAGVPVITLHGNHFSSRVSSSSLKAVGLSDMITYSLKEYEDLAVNLALNKPALIEVTQRLKKNRFTESLFDTDGFTKNLENAYSQMWHAFQTDKKPDKIEIVNKVENHAGLHNKNLDMNNELKKAVDFHRSGNLEKAEEIYINVLQIEPENADALNLLGYIACQRGQHKKSIQLIKRAIHLDSMAPSYYNNLGLAYKESGNLDEAISSYKKALQLKPDLSEAFHNMGIVFHEQKNYDEAIFCYGKAVDINPRLSESFFNSGNILKDKGETKKALSYYKKAVTIKEDYAEAYNNMGSIYRELLNPLEAIKCYTEAIKINPNCAEFYENIGITFQQSEQHGDAISFYEKAAAIKKDNPEILRNIGIAYYEMGNLKKAEEYYIKSIEIDHGNIESLAQLIHLLQQNCEWSRVEQYKYLLNEKLKKNIGCAKESAALPFLSLSLHYNDPSMNFNIAKTRSSYISNHMKKKNISFCFDLKRKNRIKIGYISNDFRNHPVAHLIMGLFELHNRSNFQINCYSYGKDEGKYYKDRIKNSCDSFVDIRNINNEDAARQIYNDKIDILVDLMGYTAGNRLQICALRPAPVQVTWLGFPGTTGACFFDYVIVDKTIVPESQKPYYSEKLVYMPHCYQINTGNQIISDKRYRKTDFGLPENSFVFCSFNQEYKIEPAIFDIWMNILHQVSGSVLWLLSKNRLAQNNLKKYAHNKGIDPRRIIFATSIEKSEHLSRHHLADLALDTRIYNGHTTTSDALWADTPVIVLTGKHFASRVSSSILSSIGLSQLRTETLNEYETVAVRLAKKPQDLNLIKEELKEKRSSEPLFDTTRYSENLESAYSMMWNIFQQGEKPDHITVVE